MRKSQLLAGVFAGALCASGAFADDVTSGTSSVGRIDVQGVGADAASEPGAGLMIPEESAKQKSTVTRAYIEEMRPTSSPFQALMMLPGVNTSSDDAYGLSGGRLTVRGFNSDQMGFTVQGVPVNDSGNYAVYPQEFVDIENLEEIFLTQGAVDTNAPHVGASGGNIGLVLTAPSDKFGGTAAQSFGQSSMSRTFARVDSGLLPTNTKFFISGSETHAEKWRGEGSDRRQHADTEVVQKIGDESDIDTAVLFNYAVNDSYRTATKAQWQTVGRKFDYDTSFVPLDTNFYRLRVNPFKNVIAETTAHLQLRDNLRLTVEPYIWYGIGNGGGATVFKESSPPANYSGFGGELSTGTKLPVDLNGNGSTRDSVLFYTPSITETYRPGIQTNLTYELDNHTIGTGFWFEHARHVQTGPAIPVDNIGNPGSIWGDAGQLVDQTTGMPAEYRKWVTINIARQFYVQDEARWLHDSLKTVVGLRLPSLERDATNNEFGVPAAYNHVSKYYADFLPTVGANYEFIQSNSVFADFTKNMRAPQNYPLFDNPPNMSQKAETSYNYELGYRYQTKDYLVQTAVFWTDFYNRQATATDPESLLTTDTNVGATRSKGVELSAGAKLSDRWSVFSSATYNDNRLRNNFLAGIGTNGLPEYLPTKGKTYIETPKILASLGTAYAYQGFFAGAQAKFTGVRYSTLVNDEKTAPYTTLDAQAGYHFGDVGWVNDPVLTFNVTNILDKNYLSQISTFKNNASNVKTAGGTVSGASPLYMLGAPRTFSLTLSAKF
ncbi:TonB-dependent receptor domain-containing protein [Telmatospirillum sp.]|uniref:TonB-dependent receptor n=1 Tax=Telmatospirillum sp. TaxID=2079197 RepID=UPI0028462A87|nr:TonB-dependent receptor [Telmatospirillum sp.]MDR3436873.1 TonB-dependent receptor [Telmatospirillum sp.]